MATRSWNRVELIGNLTRDPELRYTPSGAAVVSFSIATNRTYMSDGEKKEEADFHRIVAWNKLAELCSQLLKKGNRVFVSGRLQNRSWEGQDGQQRQTTEIVIEDMILLTSRSLSEGSSDFNEHSSSSNEDVTPTRPVRPAPKVASESEVAPEVPEETKEAASEDSGEPKEEKPKTEDPGNLDDLPF
ncbi:single-stranded DNA-binding protein [Candidatus Daviesbacteria bacterium]|nr:single-stranded DNA-binding protein [Candidatus Daviesbacteria bacterium]